MVILSKKEKDFEELTEALFKGSMALQATPMLKASGRTPTALIGTASGFVGIGIAGAVAQQSFRMVKPRYHKRIGKKRKRKGGNSK